MIYVYEVQLISALIYFGTGLPIVYIDYDSLYQRYYYNKALTGRHPSLIKEWLKIEDDVTFRPSRLVNDLYLLYNCVKLSVEMYLMTERFLFIRRYPFQNSFTNTAGKDRLCKF